MHKRLLDTLRDLRARRLTDKSQNTRSSRTTASHRVRSEELYRNVQTLTLFGTKVNRLGRAATCFIIQTENLKFDIY